MDQAMMLRTILSGDPVRLRILGVVRSIGLPDCWIAAGFVRNAVWDYLHGREVSPPAGDVDIIWFATECEAAAQDLALEARLRRVDPTIEWSVKNQARMHVRNGDPPYRSAKHAMGYWPETATAVGVRLTEHGELQIAAPFGLEDLFALVLRPTPRFADAKRTVFLDRVHAKGWLSTGPLLRLEEAGLPRAALVHEINEVKSSALRAGDSRVDGSLPR